MVKCKSGYRYDSKKKKCIKVKDMFNQTFYHSRYYKSSEGIGGISFTSLLTLLFIGLKLGNFIDWSWWWVLSPIWISLGIGILIFLIFLIFFEVGLKND